MSKYKLIKIPDGYEDVMTTTPFYAHLKRLVEAGGDAAKRADRLFTAVQGYQGFVLHSNKFSEEDVSILKSIHEHFWYNKVREDAKIMQATGRCFRVKAKVKIMEMK